MFLLIQVKPPADVTNFELSQEGNLSSPRPESALISARYAEIRPIEPYAVRLATVA